jgi:hypothetical protein
MTPLASADMMRVSVGCRVGILNWIRERSARPIRRKINSEKTWESGTQNLVLKKVRFFSFAAATVIKQNSSAGESQNLIS